MCLSSLDRVLYIAFRSLYLLAQPRDVSRTTDHSVNVYSLACISYMHCRCLSFTFLFYSSLCIFVFISLVHAHSNTFVPFITSDNPSSISGTFFFQPLLSLDALFKSGPPFCILITFTHPHLPRSLHSPSILQGLFNSSIPCHICSHSIHISLRSQVTFYFNVCAL